MWLIFRSVSQAVTGKFPLFVSFINQIEALHFICFWEHLSVCVCAFVSVCVCVCVCVHQTSHASVMAKGGPYLLSNTPAPPTHFTCSCTHDEQVRRSHTPLLSLSLVTSSCLFAWPCCSYMDNRLKKVCLSMNCLKYIWSIRPKKALMKVGHFASK